MKGRLLYSFLLSALFPVLPCKCSYAEAPAVLMERLHHAAEVTTLDSPGSAAFHLKLTIEVLPQYGRMADKGTVEMWWTSPEQNRTVYDLSQYHAIIVQTPNGLYRTATAEEPSFIVNHMLAQVLHPVPEKIDPATFKIEATRLLLGKMSLACVALRTTDSKMPDAKGTTYCFDDHSELRITLENPDQYNLRQTIGTLGTISLPTTLQYTFLRNVVAVAHIDKLQSQKTAYPEASETKDLVLVPTPPASLPAQAVRGHLIRRADPIYPDDAKQRHIAGTVLLHAIIGKDGKVERLSLIGSPDDSLTKSATKAVSQWVYEPYLLNGIATEVDTTITVNYTFALSGVTRF